MRKFFFMMFALAGAALLAGCGGGSSSDNSNSSGTISLKVTDARPVLPAGTTSLRVTFDEVSVHKSGGNWVSLPMAQSPYTIDLLQYYDGKTTHLVPPVSLASGKYTQIRLGVTSATITINGVDSSVDIPSGFLKTACNFEFEVTGGGAVDLTVDFDLSQSIVVTGPGTYTLKPVLHIVQTQEAATVNGTIAEATFGAETAATVIVTADKNNSGTIDSGDEEYTRIQVEKGTAPIQFIVYWLVPNTSYIFQVEVGGNVVYTQAVAAADLKPGAVIALKGGGTI